MDGITTTALAAELNVPIEDVHALVDQLIEIDGDDVVIDERALRNASGREYDRETTISIAAAAVVRAQIEGGHPVIGVATYTTEGEITVADLSGSESYVGHFDADGGEWIEGVDRELRASGFSRFGDWTGHSVPVTYL
jgi:hypothetical protein